jgi:hypothetical protein
MPRKKLYQDKDTIQIVIDKDKKAAFDAWCLANQTTMSDLLRQAIDRCLAGDSDKISA